MKRPPWTPAEDDTLGEALNDGLTMDELIALLPRRSAPAIAQRAAVMFGTHVRKSKGQPRSPKAFADVCLGGCPDPITACEAHLADLAAAHGESRWPMQVRR